MGIPSSRLGSQAARAPGLVSSTPPLGLETQALGLAAAQMAQAVLVVNAGANDPHYDVATLSLARLSFASPGVTSLSTKADHSRLQEEQPADKRYQFTPTFQRCALASLKSFSTDP